MTFTVDKLIVGDLSVATRRGSGAWGYALRIDVRPYTLTDGRLTEIAGDEFRLLETLGYQTSYQTTLAYPEEDDGGSPTFDTIMAAAGAWCAQTYQQIAGQWAGKTVTATVAAQEVTP